VRGGVVAVQVIGAGGSAGANGGPGGRGDETEGVLHGVSAGEALLACVDEGGGAGGMLDSHPSRLSDARSTAHRRMTNGRERSCTQRNASESVEEQ